MISLTWAIKQSFIDYVRESGGQIILDGVTHSSSGFVFPAGRLDGQYSGSVTMRAHGGALAVTVANPRTTETDTGFILEATIGNGAQCPVASLSATSQPNEFRAELTRAGAQLFDNMYPTGLELAPVILEPTRRRSVAIIGSGPAGCYTAQFLRKLQPDCEIVVFERLPVPYGLVRYGIAADHQGTKAVTRQFDRLFEQGGVTFVGNTHVGRRLPLDVVRKSFDAVVLATGLPVDRNLLIPGVGLGGVYGSGQLTRHLNGHPDDASRSIRIGSDVVIVGCGNVALDVARLLAKRPVDLEGSDLHPDHVRSTLGDAPSRITLLSRSSAAAARCDIAMLKELARLDGVRVTFPDTPDADSPLARTAVEPESSLPVHTPRVQIDFLFDTVPLEFVGETSVRAVRVERADGAEQLIPASAVVTAIGFQGEASGASDLGYRDSGLFSVGWASFGPRGALPEARAHGRDVATLVFAYLADNDPGTPRPGLVGVADQLDNPIDFAAWKRVDAAEVASAPHGRVRLKYLSTAELLAASVSSDS